MFKHKICTSREEKSPPKNFKKLSDASFRGLKYAQIN